jgi:hypothetical protein
MRHVLKVSGAFDWSFAVTFAEILKQVIDWRNRCYVLISNFKVWNGKMSENAENV